MVLVQKWPFFQLFFFSNLEKENIFYDSLEGQNAFLRYKNRKFKKSKNWHFSQGVNPWFWSKNGHFFPLLFRQLRPGKCLLGYSRTKKTPFYALKTKSSKNRKIGIFPKGLTHGFVRKIAISWTFSFSIIKAMKMSFTIY